MITFWCSTSFNFTFSLGSIITIVPVVSIITILTVVIIIILWDGRFVPDPIVFSVGPHPVTFFFRTSIGSCTSAFISALISAFINSFISFFACAKHQWLLTIDISFLAIVSVVTIVSVLVSVVTVVTVVSILVAIVTADVKTF